MHPFSVWLLFKCHFWLFLLHYLFVLGGVHRVLLLRYLEKRYFSRLSFLLGMIGDRALSYLGFGFFSVSLSLSCCCCVVLVLFLVFVFAFPFWFWNFIFGRFWVMWGPKAPSHLTLLFFVFWFVFVCLGRLRVRWGLKGPVSPNPPFLSFLFVMFWNV